MNGIITDRIRDIYKLGGDWKAEVAYVARIQGMDPLDVVEKSLMMDYGFSEEDLDEAFHTGYDDGFEAGLDEARLECDCD